MKDINLYTLIAIKNRFNKLHIKNVKYVKKIEGGMSNITYLFEANNKLYTIHKCDKDALMFVSREIEEKAYDTIKSNSTCQKAIYINKTDYKYRIFEYIDGKSMDKVNYKDYYLEIAKALKNLHNQSQLFSNNFNIFNRLDNLLSMAKGISLDPYFCVAFEKINAYRDIIEKRPLFPCHNDAQPSNLIMGDDKVSIIDFEFAGNNDYLFDIASFGNLDFNDSLCLLKEYKKDPTEEEIKLLTVYRILIDLQWYLVALIKEKQGKNKKLNLNFNDIAYYFLDASKEIINNI